MLVLDVHDRPLPETLDFWRDAGMGADMLATRAGERPFNFADCRASAAAGLSPVVAEGGTIRAGGRNWDIRCGDGHAPEHATFWSRDDDLVIGGDQLLPSISANLGVYATEPGADPVARLARQLPPLSAAGRGPPPGAAGPQAALYRPARCG